MKFFYALAEKKHHAELALLRGAFFDRGYYKLIVPKDSLSHSKVSVHYIPHVTSHTLR